MNPAPRLKPAVGAGAASFNEREMQICTVARMVEDGRPYWVAGGGSPMYAVLRGTGRRGLDRGAVLANYPHDGPGEAQVRGAGGLHLVAGVPGRKQGGQRARRATSGDGAIRGDHAAGALRLHGRPASAADR